MAQDGSVSLTTFVDFVIRSGTPRLTAVRNHLKTRDEPYAINKDFYKQLREGIQDIHGGRRELDSLGELLAAAHERKRAAYLEAINGYRRFHRAMLRDNRSSWTRPKPAIWTHGSLSVRVNPELAFVHGGRPHVVKLYLKEDALTRTRMEVIGTLMAEVLSPANASFGVLDVRRGRFHPSARSPGVDVLLRGEAQAFSSMLAGLATAEPT